MTTAELVDKYDSGNILGTLKNFPGQVEEALGLSAKVKRKPSEIVLAGMGGSALGGQLLQGLVGQELAAPFFIHRDYLVPNFVGKSSLVFVVSYSGNTEEALSSFHEAASRSAEIVAISSGGKLRAEALKAGASHIEIKSELQPRMAWGYTAIPVLNTIKHLGLTDINLDGISEVLAGKSRAYCDLDGNEAIDLAGQMMGAVPVFYSSSDQSILAYKWKINVNENAKAAAFANYLPEMNHNEITSWQKPQEELERFKLFFLRTGFESPEVTKRIEAAKEILSHSAGGVQEVASSGKSKAEAIFSNLYLGDFVSYYLALFNEVDPGPVPVIEEFKARIAERS